MVFSCSSHFKNTAPAASATDPNHLCNNAKRKSHFEESQFHDSFLLSFDFSDWHKNISVLLWCPNAGEDWEAGRYLRITFWRLLFFGFELAALGEIGGEPPMISDIILESDSERLQLWQQRIDQLAEPNMHYPSGMKSRNYTAVYHFVFDSEEFRRLAFFSELEAFQIVCRKFDVSDVTDQMPRSAPQYDPARIESE